MIRRPPRSTLFPTRRSSDLEVFARDLFGAPRVSRVITVDAIDAGNGPLGVREGEQSLAAGQMGRPARVLYERRTARRKIALRAIAEPAGARRDVRVLGHAELGL